MMSYKVTLIPGDGIGPEVTEATRRVLEATGVKFQWDIGYVGAEIMRQQVRRCLRRYCNRYAGIKLP